MKLVGPNKKPCIPCCISGRIGVMSKEIAPSTYNERIFAYHLETLGSFLGQADDALRIKRLNLTNLSN
jgi:hypothetical protein